MDYLDISKINKNNSKNIKIGEISQEIIELLDLPLNPQNIYMWSSRINEHCEKHKNEYSSPASYNQAIRSIPLILKEPDYVGLHKNGNIQFVKKLDDISLVGIQILKGNLLFRTIYPITDSKIKTLVKNGNLIKLKK